MRSHLTKTVFRSFLTGQPICARGCLRQTRVLRGRSNGFIDNSHQRRYLFGFSVPGLNDRRPNFARGRGKTLMTSQVVGNLMAARRQHLRPPPRADVAKVLRSFFESLSESTPLTEYDITFTNIALRYVKEEDVAGKKKGDIQFSEGELYNLLLALTAGAVRSSKPNEEAKELGEFVLRELTSDLEDGSVPLNESAVMQSEYAESYIELLAATGYGKSALRLVKAFGNSAKAGHSLWLLLLRSTAERRQEQELIDYTNAMFENQHSFTTWRNGLDLLIARLANLDLTAAVKVLYEEALAAGFTPTARIGKFALLRMSIRNKDIAFGQPIYDSLDRQRDASYLSRLQYLWSAAKGKPTDEIVSELDQRLAQEQADRPTRGHILGLVDLANHWKDHAAAAKYLDLLSKWGFKPNGTTYLMQFEHYLATRNIDMAVQACQGLHNHPVAAEDFEEALGALGDQEDAAQEDIHLLNQLVVAICTMEKPKYHLAIELLDSLLERTPTLESVTVAAVVGLLLPRGEYQEIHDLLQSHYPIFSKEQRDESRAVVVDYILDTNNDALSAWHAYDMFRNVFADTPITTREAIMKSFFARKRCDLACLVFGHMRQMQDPKLRPTADLYTECFKGIAACGDTKAAEMVHNMLKLDVYVDPTTRLLTSLMLAWANVGEPWRSLQIFDNILNTVEGPSYTTFTVAFRACEKFVPNGRPFAMQFMSRIKNEGFEITKDVYMAYLGAIAGNGGYDSALQLVENMEAETGYPPDALTLGTVHSTLPWVHQTHEFELWAQEKYPEAWQDLCHMGRAEPNLETGEQPFFVDRSIEI